MAAILAKKPPCLRLNRVFGPSLSSTKNWYAVSSEWSYRPREFQIGPLFAEDVVEVNISDLVDRNGAQVNPSWFGSDRKKDVVLVSTSFGIFAKAVRTRNPDTDKFIGSAEFKAVKEQINALELDKMAAIHDELPANSSNNSRSMISLPETPPSSPEDLQSVPRRFTLESGFKQPLEALAELENCSTGPRLKAKRAGAVSSNLLDVLAQDLTSGSDLGKIFGYGLLYCAEDRQNFVRDVISTALQTVSEKQGIRKALSRMLYDDLNRQYLEAQRVPDWIQLYVKLSTKLPNRSWQTLLNFLNIGRSGKSSDVGLLLTQNEIRAQKDLVFSVTSKIFKLEPLPDVRGYGISLKMAVVWQIRHARLHLTTSGVLVFSLKLDGRPLAGREQVSVGVVPIDQGVAAQSALAVYPIAIANCAEKRSEVKKLIIRLNEEKKLLKAEGVTVDGKHYKVEFKVTLDLKALYMLLIKHQDESFVLAGHGTEIQFCFLCHALRACKEHWGGSFDEVCLTCLQSKANIGKWSGIRDDLTFLLDEELTSVCLCALHSEMRNTEQLLGSLGLFAYRCNSLKECNEAISNYGPEMSRGRERISVKLRQGQQTAVNKNNISVASFSGNTERSILKNTVEIVNKSLPIKKVVDYYREVKGAARDVVLGYVTFTNAVKDYVEGILKSGKFKRDYGKYEKEVRLDDAKDLKQFLETEKAVWSRKLEEIEGQFLSCEHASLPSAPPAPPPKKRSRKRTLDQKVDHSKEDEEMATLAATLQIAHFQKIFQEWNEIAVVVRSSQFEESEDEQIDIFDVKCKLWGFVLRHVFGVTLGTGDYGHLTIDHSAMLLRLHRSMGKYSNQGFEASHKVHRALYSRATSHDQGGVAQSLDQIISHWLSELMLFLRYQFRKAKECITEVIVWSS